MAQAQLSEPVMPPGTTRPSSGSHKRSHTTSWQVLADKLQTLSVHSPTEEELPRQVYSLSLSESAAAACTALAVPLDGATTEDAATDPLSLAPVAAALSLADNDDDDDDGSGARRPRRKTAAARGGDGDSGDLLEPEVRPSKRVSFGCGFDYTFGPADEEEEYDEELTFLASKFIVVDEGGAPSSDSMPYIS